MEVTPTVTEDNTVTKRVFPLQEGLGLMKDPSVLETSRGCIDTLAGLIETDPSKAFDVIYANIPWKTVSREYLHSLPVGKLVKSGDTNGLLLWVDGGYIDEASDLVRAWGFKFHSVLHMLTHEKPPADVKIEATEPREDEASVDPTKPAPPRKAQPPWGWSSDGIVPLRTRQLWFATQSGEGDFSRFLKDCSFIRKRLSPVSTFQTMDEQDLMVTTLSAKKKNIEKWRLFPEYDVYTPNTLRQTIEGIFKPTARVVSLFGNALSKTWYTWGPNIPGYLSGPLRNDCGFPLVSVLLKYFASVKVGTAQRYINMVNVYAIQYAKSICPGGEQTITPLLESRITEFINEMGVRAESSGGIRENPLNMASKVQLVSAETFLNMDPLARTQFITLIAQVIKGVVQKSADAAEKRKRCVKRKRDMGETEKKAGPRVGYGIAAPVEVSSELADFMGLGADQKVARTSVVKFINQYISDNKLQNPDRRNQILLDDRLQALLRPSASFGAVTYFNLCQLLRPHYVLPNKKIRTEETPL